MPDINCDVTVCKFNQNYKCMADSIKVTSNVRSMSWSDTELENATMIPQSSSQTRCETFVPRS